MFGPDPSSSNRATIGGVIGNNSTGAHSILYGMTADHVVSARITLAGGGTFELAPGTADELTALAAHRRCARSPPDPAARFPGAPS